MKELLILSLKCQVVKNMKDLVRLAGYSDLPQLRVSYR